MRILIFLIILLQTSVFSQSKPEMITSLTSSNFVTGEVGFMNFVFPDQDLHTPPPESIVVPGLNIQRVGFMLHVENHRRYYIYNYRFVAMHPGSYTIPAIEFDSPAKKFKSTPQLIEVIDRDDLRPTSIDVGNQIITYYSKLFAEKSILYPGQTSQLEYKIYLPENIRVMQWGLPIPKSMKNLTAWRFTSPEQESDIGTASIAGKSYQVASYKTVLTAGNPGKAQLGVLNSRSVSAMSFIDPYRGNVVRRVDLPITHPASEFTVIPYPVTPPPGFQGAVGDFKITAEVPVTAEMKTSDTLKATVLVEGRGNFADLVAPALAKKTDWNIIDSSRIQQGEERTLQQGNAGFTYILSPNATTTTTPSFKFVSFNPITASFVTHITPVAPLNVIKTAAPIASAATPTAADTPVENMRDIIAVLPVGLMRHQPHFWQHWPSWLWHLIPAALLLLMLIHQTQSYLLRGKAARAIHRSKMNDLKNLSSQNEPFLKASGKFIQKWLQPDKHPELQQILHERDQQCYQPEATSLEPDAKRRREIIKILKKFSILLLCFVLTSLGSAKAGDDELEMIYKSNNYPRVIEHLQAKHKTHKPTSPDYSAIQFHLARAYYRTDKPGSAAYHYQLALDARPDFLEAKKNLAFIQHQQGSIVPQDEKLSGLDHWIAKLPPTTYRQISYSGIWLLALSLIYLKIYRPKGWKFGSALTLSFLAPLLLIASLYAESQHPHRVLGDSYTPAMVIKSSPLLTEPIDLLPEVKDKHTLLNTPAASPCQLIAVRGEWSYIQLTNGLRGWIISDAVAPL